MFCLFPAKVRLISNIITLYFFCFGILKTCHNFFITVNMHLKGQFIFSYVYGMSLCTILIVIRVRYINYVRRCVAKIYLNNETYYKIVLFCNK